MTAPHHVYLVSGMFGFSNLAGYDYFGHLRRALESGFGERGHQVVVHVVAPPPTSGIPERARVLARTVHHTAESEGPIHIVGHSTGGIDARLVLSPARNLGLEPAQLAWTKRVHSAVSLNAPHYGSPLATYFATVAGTRVLYAISLLTIISLSLGASSLTVLSKLLAGIGSVDQLVGNDFRLVSRATDLILDYIERDSRGAVHSYLDKVRVDQGGIIQTTPEAMDLFNAAIVDASDVRYGCVVTTATPRPRMSLPRRLWSPYAAFSGALFAMIHRITSQAHDRYGYPNPSPIQAAALKKALGTVPDENASDGVVPTLSMLWDRLVWCGTADHLDVLGHFQDDQRPTEHIDWMTSTGTFGREQFRSMVDAIVAFQLDG